MTTDDSVFLHDDRTLAKAMLRGDEAAFDAFFDRHFPGLYRFALARLGQNPDAAQEAVQSAMARAIRKLGTFRGEATLFTWLCTFCRHEIAAHWRSRAAAPAPIEDTPEIRAALEEIRLLAADRPYLRPAVGFLISGAYWYLPWLRSLDLCPRPPGSESSGSSSAP